MNEDAPGFPSAPDDAFWMARALDEARLAYALGEVPIGAVIVQNGQVIGRGHNTRNTEKNPLHHAEILAIDQAAAAVGDWRLEDCTLYVTVEPCPMCAGALVQARIPRVVFGVYNPKAGCGGSIYNLLQEPQFNHQLEVVSGVGEADCRELMQRFFKDLRARKQAQPTPPPQEI